MLQIGPEAVCFIVVKARAFDAKVDVVEENPGSNASDEDMREVLEDYDDDPTFDELKAFIDSQNEDAQVDLVALAWTGRGDFTTEEWEDARAEARRAHNEHTAEYLLGIPKLGDYLENAMAQMGYSFEEYELNRL